MINDAYLQDVLGLITMDTDKFLPFGYGYLMSQIRLSVVYLLSVV